jgi:hypothetical protein
VTYTIDPNDEELLHTAVRELVVTLWLATSGPSDDPETITRSEYVARRKAKKDWIYMGLAACFADAKEQLDQLFDDLDKKQAA